MKGDETLEPEDDGLFPVWVPAEDGSGLVEKRVSRTQLRSTG